MLSLSLPFYTFSVMNLPYHVKALIYLTGAISILPLLHLIVEFLFLGLLFDPVSSLAASFQPFFPFLRGALRMPRFPSCSCTSFFMRFKPFIEHPVHRLLFRL